MTLTAPNLFGTVQVTDLAPMGSLAREKDLIVEYDDSERQSALEMIERAEIASECRAEELTLDAFVRLQGMRNGPS